MFCWSDACWSFICLLAPLLKFYRWELFRSCKLKLFSDFDLSVIYDLSVILANTRSWIVYRMFFSFFFCVCINRSMTHRHAWWCSSSRKSPGLVLVQDDPHIWAHLVSQGLEKQTSSAPLHLQRTQLRCQGRGSQAEANKQNKQCADWSQHVLGILFLFSNIGLFFFCLILSSWLKNWRV